MFNNLFDSSENSPFNQATELFHNLRNFPSGSADYLNTILEIIKLCQAAIQKVSFDGDAHVLLANVYLLAALNGVFTKSYPFFLAKAASVIEATKTGNMPIRNRENADKVYRGIVEQLSAQTPNWVKNVRQLPKDMSRLQKQYYKDALDPSTVEEIKKMIRNE